MKLLLATFAFAILTVPDTAAMAQVEISLRRSVSLNTNVIRLGDIAEIRGGDDSVNQQLRQLDLGILPDDGGSVTIAAARVSIRLRLSGNDSHSFQITGAKTSTVRRNVPEPITDTRIEAAAVPTMMAALGVTQDSDLRVQLNTPVMASLPKSIQQDTGLRVEVLPPLTSRIGTVSLTVRLFRGARLIQSRSARFEVFQKQRVAITRTSLPRSHVIEARDVQFTDRFLAVSADQLDESQVIGRQIRSGVPAGRMLALRDLIPVTAAKTQHVVRTRDNVQVTAVSGRLRVKLTAAEAMQSGRQGDVIRVRNTRSQEIITGRVTGPGMVEIQL